MASTKKAPLDERPFDGESLVKGDSEIPPPPLEPEPAPKAAALPQLPSRAERKATPPAPPAVALATYRVWEHGTFRRNGVTHKPGDTLTLPVSVGDAVDCLVRT